MDGLVRPQQSTLDNNGSNNGAVSVSLLRAPKSAARKWRGHYVKVGQFKVQLDVSASHRLAHDVTLYCREPACMSLYWWETSAVTAATSTLCSSQHTWNKKRSEVDHFTFLLIFNPVSSLDGNVISKPVEFTECDVQTVC